MSAALRRKWTLKQVQGDGLIGGSVTAIHVAMRKGWLGATLILVLAAVFALQFYRQASQPQSFNGCYEIEGRRLVFSGGRLLIDGLDAGSFQYFKGDATKGPDTIALSAATAGPTGIDRRRMLQVTPNGLQVPLEAGAYGKATRCS